MLNKQILSRIERIEICLVLLTIYCTIILFISGFAYWKTKDAYWECIETKEVPTGFKYIDFGVSCYGSEEEVDKFLSHLEKTDRMVLIEKGKILCSETNCRVVINNTYKNLVDEITNYFGLRSCKVWKNEPKKEMIRRCFKWVLRR